MRQIFTTAFMLFLAISAFAQHTIKGKVLDEKGNTLTGATVTVQNSSLRKTTDADGSFLFDGLTKIHYTLKTTYVGYETTVTQVDADHEIVVTLKSKSVSMNEITVTSLRANDRSAVAYSDVSAEKIEQRNLGQDIPYLLALTPSFITTSDAGAGVGYTGFRIRGTDANRINITVNDIPLNDAESHGTFFVNMPDFASSLSSVQVQRGVGTSTNGAAAFGASINMQTEGLNTKPYAEVSSTYGSFNTNKNMLKAGTGLMNNGFAFDARLSNVTSDGYIDRAWVDMKSYYFSAGYYSDKTTLKFLTFGGNEKTYQAWNGLDATLLESKRTYNELGAYKDSKGVEQFYNNQTDNYNQTHYQLHWLQELSPKLHFNTSAHLTRGLGYYEEYKTNKSYSEYKLTPDSLAGVSLETTDLVRQKWLDNYFYGITWALNYEAQNWFATFGGAINQYIGNHFGKVIWVRNANNLDVNNEFYRSKSLKDDANIYAKVNVEFFRNFFTSVDLQYRHIYYSLNGQSDKYDKVNNRMLELAQAHSFDFFNPKVGLTYKINQQNTIYASYSVSNREPNRNNYTEAGANEQPTYETLYDTETGYSFKSTRFSAGANLYFMNYKNQLILTGKISEIGELLTSNVAQSYRAGIEFTVATKITNWLKWDGNITFCQNKILNFVEQDVDKYDTDWNWIGSQNNVLGTTDIAYSPNIVGNSIFTFNYKTIEFGIYSNYVGKQYFDNTSDIQRSIKAYFVNNLSLKYSLPTKKAKNIEFKILINNIFNIQYETNAYTWYSCYVNGQRYNETRVFPQAGINLLAGITVKF